MSLYLHGRAVIIYTATPSALGSKPLVLTHIRYIASFLLLFFPISHFSLSLITMHAATMFFALSAALPAVLAYDPEFLTWCHESEVNVNGVSCLGWQMPDKCADCLMPIEHQCSGEWDSDEFLDCFCPIPTGQWPKIQSCFNNAANECQNDPTEVFNGYSTMCFKWRERQAEYVCEPKNQQGNLAVTKLARFVCDDS